MDSPLLEYWSWELPRGERAPPPRPGWRVPLLLLLLTAATTTVIGARLAFNFARRAPAYALADDLFPFVWAWHHPGLLAAGVPFSLALLSILLAHELGHYLACRYYRLDSTYPIFLPAPTLIGTMGAVIRIRSPFNNRRELFDVGIAGPLAGFALALPLLLYGLAASGRVSLAQALAWRGQVLEFGWPPLARWAQAWLHPGAPVALVALSPVARAAFVGLLVTMLNLLPAAQLDGGHIVYACSPRLHRILSWTALIVLLLAGWRWWPGWYVWAGFIALMRVRHPRVPTGGSLGAGRAWLAALALALLLVCFTAVPFLAA